MTLALAGLSYGDIIQTFVVPGSGYNNTIWSNTYNIATFNTALGTLNSVTISIVDNLKGSVTVTNNSGSSGNYNAQLSSETWFSTNSSLLTQNGNTFIASDPGAPSVFYDAVDTQTSATFSIANGNGGQVTKNLTGTDSTGGFVDPTTFTDQYNNQVFTLSQFQSNGAGVLQIYELVAGKTGYLGPAPASSAGTPTSNTTLIVDYNYTPAQPTSSTPEPATMALMGSALVGLSLLGKRFKRK
ncbi:MAG: PEP-CTERM sorting domain-containing protein [Acidobacteriota bacterium]|nr:PEP-CTERM sorting domain-containing protein [Acidobacteriota bacterium]